MAFALRPPYYCDIIIYRYCYIYSESLVCEVNERENMKQQLQICLRLLYLSELDNGGGSCVHKFFKGNGGCDASV